MSKGNVPEASPPPVQSAPARVYLCQLYFWQQAEGGPIKIGRVSKSGNAILLRMRGPEEEPTYSLRVGTFDDAQACSILHQLKPHRVEGQTAQLFNPTQEFLDFISQHTAIWVPQVKAEAVPKPIKEKTVPEPKKSKAVMEERTCKGCGLTFRTSVKNLYCKECAKVWRSRMYAEGYLKPIPYTPGSKPDNANAARELHSGEPSPWNENAVRHLEDS